MKKMLYKIWSAFLTAFGNIKLFKWPMFVIYDPTDYAMTGEKVLDLMETLKPGDLVFRGFNNYADGKLVPGDFSHGAIYVGNNKLIHAVAKGVSEIDVIEFSRCDRIAVMRPRKYVRSALKKAKSFLADKIPYDFGYNKNVSALYCFELCGECYEKLNVELFEVKYFLGLVKRKNVYLAKSFLESQDFECVFMYNPRRNIDFKK